MLRRLWYKKSILYKTSIYCRLCLGDESLGESDSIQAQKMMQEEYFHDDNFLLLKKYMGLCPLLVNMNVVQVRPVYKKKIFL